MPTPTPTRLTNDLPTEDKPGTGAPVCETADKSMDISGLAIGIIILVIMLIIVFTPFSVLASTASALLDWIFH